jgi:two-component system, chemotaxis family, sensor kinase CheA
MSDFQQEYIAEAKQLLKDLEHALLQLEKDQGNSDSIDTAYRLLHTLKGSAGMFGFNQVEKLAHELEYVFSDIRDGIRQQDDFIVDLALHAIDVFTDLINGVDSAKDVEKIIEDINRLKSENGVDANGNTTGKDGRGKKEGFVIWLTPEKNIFRRGINFNAILQEIDDLGTSETYIHEETIPFEKQVLAKEITSRFEILLVTKAAADTVKEVFMFMKGTEYEILPIADKDVFSSEVYTRFKKLSSEEMTYRLNFLQSALPEMFVEIEESTEQVENQVSTAVAEEDTEGVGHITKRSAKNSHVNVSTGKLDHLINVVSELVIFRSEINHLLSDIKNPVIEEALEKLERLTLKLRDSAFHIRLVPLSILNVKLQRLIRSLSKDLGKEVEFITEGLDTELDRSMISALEGPIMHIIRNAIDHGIEKPEERERRNKPRKGLLKFYSYNSGDHVFIQVQDDGNGIDFERIRNKGIEKGLLVKNQNYTEKELLQVMMMPGFSTAERITTVSGRGVGMDVVKKDIAAIRGDIEVSSEKGLGSIFTLRLPLTLTILDTLVVDVSTNKYLIPISEIEYCFKQEHSVLFNKKSRQITHEGQLLPFVSLREYFGITEFPKDETVIIINKNDTRVAVVVDSIIGKLQTVYKPLNELLHGAECFSGASILGDGSMALILNALKLKN